ncbi:MAG: WG repeat-containing protein [Planctomycetes bacterium]|nr:WG repeat-containing protein [Planctomycetota bacterium]
MNNRKKPFVQRWAIALLVLLAFALAIYFPISPTRIHLATSIPAEFDFKAEEPLPVLFSVQVNGKDGYIDKNGRVVIEPKFDQMFTHFVGKYAVASRPGEWLKGYIDRTGNWYIEPKYGVAYPFREGVAVIATDKGWGLINENDKFVIEPMHDRTQGFANGVAAIGTETWASQLHRKFADVGYYYDWIYFDRTGRVVPESTAKQRRASPKSTRWALGDIDVPTLERMFDYYRDIDPAKLNSKWGYVDRTGAFVIKPQFDEAYPFTLSEKVAVVRQNGKFGLIDLAGHWIVAPTIDWGDEVEFGMWRVTKDRKVGYMDMNGKWIWKPTS